MYDSTRRSRPVLRNAAPTLSAPVGLTFQYFWELASGTLPRDGALLNKFCCGDPGKNPGVNEQGITEDQFRTYLSDLHAYISRVGRRAEAKLTQLLNAKIRDEVRRLATQKDVSLWDRSIFSLAASKWNPTTDIHWRSLMPQ